MKKTIVLIGATGKVGSKISQIFLNEGHHLIAQTAEAFAEEMFATMYDSL
jgi:putative NADH-flavin reductase